MKRSSRGIILTAFLLLVLPSLLIPPSVEAQTDWIPAIVTRSPWTDRHERIEINGMVYTFMPHASIWKLRSEGEGQFGEEREAMSSLRQGCRIQARVQGFRVYEIIILQ